MKFVCPVCGYVYEGDSGPPSTLSALQRTSIPRSFRVSETTSRASAARSVCILQWQESLTERVIPR